MKGLVLAEKPSLMRAIQSAYKADKFPFLLDFAAFHGHLMELAEPADYNAAWKKWELSALPMIPNKFKYLPKDGESVKKILAKIKAGSYDFVVNACDAGREGELIFWSFYEANHLKLPVKRLWSSTTVEKDLQAALHNLRDYTDPALANLKLSAEFRAQFDWLTGMNFSRAVGLKTNKAVNIGRVVTATDKMVVLREEEIKNFVPETFYEVGMTLEKDKSKFSGVVLAPPDCKKSRFKDKDAAQKAMDTLGKVGTVTSVDRKEKATKAPTLYSTLELQKDANKYFKYRATKTDAIAQELYEAGYISYPRTSCRFIPTSMVAQIPSLLKPLEKFTELDAPLKLVTPAAIKAATTGKDYVDDSKLTDHHAIIPTTAVFDPSTLSIDQKNIYLLVAKRFLAIFLPPYKVANTTVLLDCGGNTVQAAGRIVLDKGFSMLYQEKTTDVILPPLAKGDAVNISAPVIREGKTQPPSRYTDKTLLDAMANAGRFVSAAEQRAILKEAAGIGTDATRSSILEKLEKTNMVTVEKGFFIPTAFSISLMEALGDRSICSPALTAEWEQKLRDLEENGHPDVFQKQMMDYVRSETADLIANVNKDLSAYRFTKIGTCPICGKDVVISQNYFRCVNYKADTDPCTFIVSRKEVMGTTITETDMKKLLTGKPTAVKTLTSKDGRQYKAALVIDKNGRLAPAIGENAPQESADRSKTKTIKGICACPLCKGRLFEGKNYFLCTHRDDGCSFVLAKTLCSAPITKDDVKVLAAGETTEKKSFVWKSGKSGTARLKGEVAMKDGKKVFNAAFVFDR